MKTKNVSKIIFFSFIASTFLFAFVQAKLIEDSVPQTGCDNCHTDIGTPPPRQRISTNYTSPANEITIQQGKTFDILLTVTNIDVTGSGVSIGIWWDGIRSMGVPSLISVSSGTISEYADQWTTSPYYYYQGSSDNAGGSTFTAVVRITPTSSGAPFSEEIYIMSASKSKKASSDEITFTINVEEVIADSNPPEVNNVEPTDNNYVRGNVVINASVTDADPGVSSVWAEVTNTTGYNQTVSMSESTAPYYDGTWNTAIGGITDGDYNITVKANDTETPSNLNNTEYVTVTVDNKVPTIVLDSVVPDPSNGQTVITAKNTTEFLVSNGMKANVSLPLGGYLYPALSYQGSSIWNGIFTVTQNGTHTVSVNGTDLAGNVGYGTPIDITGDVGIPGISLSVTPDPSNGETTITAYNNTEILDGNGILANVSLPGGGYIYPAMTYRGLNKWNGTFDVTSNGIYTISVNGTDLASNTGYTTPVSITGDVKAPWITLDAVTPDPSNGETVITVTNYTSDFDANGVRANVSTPGNKWIFVDLTYYSGPKIGNGIFTVTENGQYEVWANATDLAGNFNVTSSITITGDVKAPWITLDTVTPDPSNGETVITVTNYTSDFDANGVRANVSTPGNKWIFVDLTYYSGPKIWNGTFTVTEDGTYEVWTNATDLAGNFNVTSSITITGDVKAPWITLDTVTPDPSNGETVITVRNYTSDFDVNGVRANVSTPSNKWIFVDLTYYSGPKIWNGTFIVTENGQYEVWANATDLVGNFNVTSSITITGDVKAPWITLDTVTPDPSNGETVITVTNYTSDFDVNGVRTNISTPGGGWIFVDLTYYLGPKIWNGTFIVTENGQYEVWVNATDLAGNFNVTSSITITGDVKAPWITLDTVTPDPSNGETVITVTNYTSDFDANGVRANISTPGNKWIFVDLTY